MSWRFDLQSHEVVVPLGDAMSKMTFVALGIDFPSLKLVSSNLKMDAWKMTSGFFGRVEGLFLERNGCFLSGRVIPLASNMGCMVYTTT